MQRIYDLNLLLALFATCTLLCFVLASSFRIPQNARMADTGLSLISAQVLSCRGLISVGVRGAAAPTTLMKIHFESLPFIQESLYLQFSERVLKYVPTVLES